MFDEVWGKFLQKNLKHSQIKDLLLIVLIQKAILLYKVENDLPLHNIQVQKTFRFTKDRNIAIFSHLLKCCPLCSKLCNEFSDELIEAPVLTFRREATLTDILLNRAQDIKVITY